MQLQLQYFSRMIPILSRQEAYELDNISIQNFYDEKGIIDTAGKKIAIFVLENFKNIFEKEVLIICGKGNNGNEGLVAHNYLKEYGVNSKFFLPFKNFGDSWVYDDYNILKCDLVTNLKSNDYIIIDALFGIGFNSKINRYFKNIINWCNDSKDVVSIDLPSGLDTSTGNICEVCVFAKFTITMGYPKIGLLINQGIEYSGKIVTSNIGLSKINIQNHQVFYLENKDFYNIIKHYKKDTNKYKRGKVLIVAGSREYPGAAILAAKSTIKSGSGIVKLVSDPEIRELLESNLIEIILEDKSKTNLLDWPNSILIGPGMGTDKNDLDYMCKIYNKIKIPCVIDASAFMPLAQNMISLCDLPENCILTPHLGEFSKIFNIPEKVFRKDPISQLKKIYKNLDKKILLLKGPTNYILNGDGKIFIDNSGHSLLATAGTGDILSGIIASFLSQGYNNFDSTICANRILSMASNMFREKNGPFGMCATDILQYIPASISALCYEN